MLPARRDDEIFLIQPSEVSDIVRAVLLTPLCFVTPRPSRFVLAAMAFAGIGCLRFGGGRRGLCGCRISMENASSDEMDVRAM